MTDKPHLELMNQQSNRIEIIIIMITAETRHTTNTSAILAYSSLVYETVGMPVVVGEVTSASVLVVSFLLLSLLLLVATAWNGE